LLIHKKVPISIDGALILGSIGAGLILVSKNNLELQEGAYVIIAGYIGSLVTQIISGCINATAAGAAAGTGTTVEEKPGIPR
jgi:hypothetical protein